MKEKGRKRIGQNSPGNLRGMPHTPDAVAGGAEFGGKRQALQGFGPKEIAGATAGQRAGGMDASEENRFPAL